MGFLPGCEKNYGINTMEKHQDLGSSPSSCPRDEGIREEKVSLTQAKGFTDLPPPRLSGISKISSQPTPVKAEVQKEGKGVFQSFQRNGGFRDPLPAAKHPTLTGFPVLFLPCSLSTSHPRSVTGVSLLLTINRELGKF